ncbi:hypothetical protein QNF02_004325 [Vibrio vulnificus]|uniref:hypothetical protein n=1 Tax=Vibrio sp. S9_S30 TaxID=2720226 RepID=UPI0016806D5C|nr:hypothetical protein [Vibrio sp. S9_S30]EIN9358098.1 hypothetical protein [Vibrio vulnificus]ELC9574672.1 hypothetical protein [Vibrio vulnificus]ELV8587822.1 hypothetical protein [Vibrio vulnificus]ELV8640298.1 hypothetical protein [Vibrio vulnificus]ELV8706733.1 hypothetical protein [Vibrio vulnificus]
MTYWPVAAAIVIGAIFLLGAGIFMLGDLFRESPNAVLSCFAIGFITSLVFFSFPIWGHLIVTAVIAAVLLLFYCGFKG